MRRGQKGCSSFLALLLVGAFFGTTTSLARGGEEGVEDGNGVVVVEKDEVSVVSL